MTTTDTLTGHGCVDTQRSTAGEGPNIRGGHERGDTQRVDAAAEQTPEPTTDQSIPMAAASARAPLPPAPAIRDSEPRARTSVPVEHGRQGASGTLCLADPFLALAADVLDDLETVRVANENRLRQLTRDETDSDGRERGFGLTLDHPDVARLAALVDDLARAEHQAELNLRRLLRRHPLGPWIKAARGVGEKQGARLLAAIGDPYWNDLHGRPRTVSELWAYCGYSVRHPASQGLREAHSAPAGGVAPKRQRGQRSNWNETARMRAYLVSVSIVKAGGPYRDIYDTTRAKYTDATHATPCVRCGPAGHPAPVGSPLSAGHQHARAVRAVSKEILRDLWIEARRLHGEAS